MIWRLTPRAFDSPHRATSDRDSRTYGIHSLGFPLQAKLDGSSSRSSSPDRQACWYQLEIVCQPRTREGDGPVPPSRSTNIERVHQLASLFSSSFKRAHPRVLTSTVSELCRSGPRPYLLYPMFSFTKTSMHSDLLVPSFSNDFYTEVGKDPTWEGKRQNKVLWRGETTGAWHAQGSGWRNTQRARLVSR